MTTKLTAHQQIRVAAVTAAATFCAPCDGSTAVDVLRIAEQLADYIQDGHTGTTS